MAHGGLRLKPLEASQYKQVAEWECGPLPENTDWARYEAEMGAPQWSHYGLYDGAEFVGCVSFERDRWTVAYHVVTGRHKVHPNALAQVLLNTAGALFERGFTALTARIPHEKRAAARLALRCGMREWGHTPEIRYFMLTEKRFRNGVVKT